MSPAEQARLAHLADEQLVERAGQGDRVALDVLLRRHQLLVYRVCRRLCAEEADALDATQEALITVARRIDRFDGRSAFTTWLYRVTTNACLDELRRRRRRPPLAGTSEDAERERATVAPPARSADPADAAADRVDLDRAMAQLTPAARAVIVLRDLAGLDYAEIAAVLEVPSGTVKSRLARARAQLAARLDRSPPAGDASTSVADERNRSAAQRRPIPDAIEPIRPRTDRPTESTP